jgi:hypothetical protein
MSAPFNEVQFPVHIAVGAEAILRSKTQIFTAGGGAERRNKRWARQLREWNAARGINSTEDLEEVRAFHICMDGRHAGFRFKDFSDYTALNQRIDTSAGAATFQLRKAYTAGQITKQRVITKPVEGTLVLNLNGRTVAYLSPGQTGFDAPLFGEEEFGGGSGASLAYAPANCCDWTTGLVSVPAWSALTSSDVLLASFEFDCPARFGSDEFKVRTRPRGNSWEYGEIIVKETK